MSLFLVKNVGLNKFDGNQEAALDLLKKKGRPAFLDSNDNVVSVKYPERCKGAYNIIYIIDSRVANTVEGFADFVKDNGRLLFFKDIQALNQE